MSDFKCASDDCGGWVCIYHGLSHEAKEYIDQLEAKLALYRKVYEKADELLWLGESHRLPDFDEMIAWMEKDEQS